MTRPDRGTSVRTVSAWLCLLLLAGCAAGSKLPPNKARDASRYNAELGANYLQRGNLELARDKLEKALEQDDRNALAHVTYAQLQQRIDESRAARRHFKRAIALEPDEPEHRNSYGVFLCEAGDVGAAEREFVRAATNPFYETPEYALDNAGLCLLDARRLDESERYLRDALRSNPQFASAYLHMAALLLERERLTLADAYHQRFAAYSPPTAESLWLEVRLKQALGRPDESRVAADALLDRFAGSREASELLATPLD